MSSLKGFKLVGHFIKKSNAKKRAENLRKKGFYTRITIVKRVIRTVRNRRTGRESKRAFMPTGSGRTSNVYKLWAKLK